MSPEYLIQSTIADKAVYHITKIFHLHCGLYIVTHFTVRSYAKCHAIPGSNWKTHHEVVEGKVGTAFACSGGFVGGGITVNPCFEHESRRVLRHIRRGVGRVDGGGIGKSDGDTPHTCHGRVHIIGVNFAQSKPGIGRIDACLSPQNDAGKHQ